MSEQGMPAETDMTPFPLRLKRFTSFCEGEAKELDRADANAILAAMRDMSQRVFRQMAALNTMQQSLPMIQRAMQQGCTLIDAFNIKVAEAQQSSPQAPLQAAEVSPPKAGA